MLCQEVSGGVARRWSRPCLVDLGCGAWFGVSDVRAIETGDNLGVWEGRFAYLMSSSNFCTS
jgi:hypothetical protein